MGKIIKIIKKIVIDGMAEGYSENDCLKKVEQEIIELIEMELKKKVEIVKDKKFERKIVKWQDVTVILESLKRGE